MTEYEARVNRDFWKSKRNYAEEEINCQVTIETTKEAYSQAKKLRASFKN